MPGRWPTRGQPGQGQGRLSPLCPRAAPTGTHSGTLGGWQLAVSKYSKVKDEAADLVKYLTSEAEQKRRAIEGCYNPTYRALYQDPEVLAASPIFSELVETFTNAVARPSRVTGTRYNQVSNEFWNAVHATLSGEGDAQSNLSQLSATLNRLSRGGRRW